MFTSSIEICRRGGGSVHVSPVDTRASVTLSAPKSPRSVSLDHKRSVSVILQLGKLVNHCLKYM